MKKKIVVLFVLMAGVFQLGMAQTPTAEQLITNLLNEAKNGAVKTTFKLTASDKKNSQVSDGTFTIKGNKFVLEMDQMKVYFDGKTQWAYVPSQNEVSITEPTEKELTETNPMAILASLKNKSIIRFAPKSLVNGNYNITLLPKNKQQDIVKIEVVLNKTTNHLVSIKVFNKTGSTYLLGLTNYTMGLKFADTNFVFNTLKYKSVGINDLR
jgi:outer membrane lipoprotein-sorting protein